jgi:fatty acid desaturase
MSKPDPERLAALRDDLDALHREARASVGAREYRHLRKMEKWGWGSTLMGLATAWIAPNPLSALLLAVGNVARWTIVAHHVSHRGYDRIPGVAQRHTSKGFARGWRRFLHWPEWMLPEAWSFEHNVLHHYHTGEALDPDLVERNFTLMRESRAPRWVKYLVIGVLMCTWKIIYYAPNTLWMLRARRALKASSERSARVDEVMALEPTRAYHGLRLLLPLSPGGRELWARCFLPVALLRFGLLPALFLPLGTGAALSVLLNVVLAEALANLHAFLIIVPNHSGADLHRYAAPIEDRAEFYWRQITGSANYTGGTDLSDFLQGYLNYQIEHHLWPSLPALTYRDLQPKVQAVCEKHGIPYVSEPLPRRVGKMVRLMTGDASMTDPGPERLRAAEP